MVSTYLLSALAIAYLGLLFAVAFYGERRSIYPANARLRPWIYGLALGVYCTTWTFFGAVGTAVRDGWVYVPIYLGPVLVFLVATPFLQRLVTVARAHNITTIADLVSARFGKSPALAALVTVVALTAVVPYLALQYKAVGSSIDVLTGTGHGSAAQDHPLWLADPAFGVAMLMALFAILFGTRRLDASEHHEGVMLAIAFESVVKLIAFVTVGFFAWSQLDLLPARPVTQLDRLDGARALDLAVTTALSAAAIFCLPRQFLVGVVECADPADVRRARWLFAGYLALFTLFVVPIALAGVASGAAAQGNPDSLVLSLPLRLGAESIALLGFLGGLSAATAMAIVSSIALATMLTNDLVMPLVWRSRWTGTRGPSDVGRMVLWLRRAAILLLAGLAYAYYRNIGGLVSLASIGMLAFAAVAQFAPAILAGLYWPRATRTAVFWGLATGYALWLYTLVLPDFLALAPAGRSVLEHGPAGIGWLRPHALFGFEWLGPVPRGALVALAGNVLVLAGLSALRGSSLRERMAARSFVRGPEQQASARVVAGARIGDLLALTERILGAEHAARALRDYCVETGRPQPRATDSADRGLLQHMERVLAGAIGAPSARLMLTHALLGRGFEVDEAAELLDETTQELRFSRRLLQATMENIAQGISVVDDEARLVGWNRRYLEMFDYPEGLVAVGRPVADLIRWNAARGELGPGDPEQHVEKRLGHLRAGSAYVIQRERRSGRVYEIRGQPMPDGGFVTTYTDITDFKRTEQALREAKLTLEERVEERTSELTAALAAQQAAKRLAEEANATKTRFVAAASHDLLQPLNAARLFASALEARAADEEVLEIARRIDSSMRAAEEVLNDMLDIARLESGSMRTEVTEFPVDALLEEIERQFAPLADRRGLRLRVRRRSEWVRTDRVLLRRILQNLVSNALRYTQRGGVLISARRRGADLRLEVWDTGPGVAEQHRQAIFEEFRRLDRVSPWGETGMGLGLSICARISQLLSLPLGLRSTPGRGSAFSVLVPRTSPAPAAPPVAPPPIDAGAQAGLVGLRVLCIDDDVAILEGMASLLTRWGAIVATARDPAEARRVAADVRPDVVLADLHLGAGQPDGLDLLLEFAAARGAAVQGALITADYGPSLAERARASGYTVLRKPVKPAALRALLGSLAAARRPAAPAPR